MTAKTRKSKGKRPTAKKRPSAGARPIAKDSPKGKVVAMMLEGTRTFEQIAKKIGTTTSNARQHARQLKARGFSYAEAEDGTVKLVVPDGAEVFAP
jgi:hypothetical protein